MKKIICTLLLTSIPATLIAQTCQSTVIDETTPAGTGRFIDNANGTITDNQTGLMWKQCLEGMSTSSSACDTGTATTPTWQQALQIADTSTYATYNDWRLPNIKELSTIVEQSCYDPALNETLFPNTPPITLLGWTWSSTPNATDSTSAWGITFTNGNDITDIKTTGGYVRLVRGGK